MAHGKSLQLRSIPGPVRTTFHLSKWKGAYRSPERSVRKREQLEARRAARRRAIANGKGARS